MICLIDEHLWEIPIDIFGATVYCVYAEHEEDWVKYLDPIRKDSSVEWMDGLKQRVMQASVDTNAATVANRKTIVILFHGGCLSHSTIVHECVHCAYDLVSGTGIKDANNEVEAYLTAYIFDKIQGVLMSPKPKQEVAE